MGKATAVQTRRQSSDPQNSHSSTYLNHDALAENWEAATGESQDSSGSAENNKQTLSEARGRLDTQDIWPACVCEAGRR